MNYFDILLQMKTGQKVPYSKDYFDTLFTAKLAEMQIKTLTGTLPLTFRTSETALRSWTIYGNNYEHTYSADHTLPLTFSTNTAGAASDWSISGNDDVGKNLCNENDVDLLYVGNDRYRSATSVGKLPAGTYTLSYEKLQTSILYVTIRSGTNYSDATANSPYTFTVRNNDDEVIIRTAISTLIAFEDIGITNVMLNAGNTSADFEPYQVGVGQRTENGYIIPLSVNGDTVNLPIGNAPLTAGQSISKTSTGVDISAVQGANTITTDLYNKPEMSIEGVDYVGVGEMSGNNWQIPLYLLGAAYKFPWIDSHYQIRSHGLIIDGDDNGVLHCGGALNDSTTAFYLMLGNDNPHLPAGDYIFTGCENSAQYGYTVQVAIRTGGSQIYVTDNGQGARFTLTAEGKIDFVIANVNNATAYGQTIDFTMPLKFSSIKTVDVPIDAPLTDGQSITDTLTISTFEGENTIDTTMTNKPNMSITYKGG